MKKTRLEAFSDGLFAVVITIMVLELKAPVGGFPQSLIAVLPVFFSYVLSFMFGAIFWINHHHLLAATCKIDSKVLLANLNFLFWLSLIPFFTSWVDENHLESIPVAGYGIALLMVFFSYRILEKVLFRANEADSVIVRILKRGRRENLSMIVLLLGIVLSFVHPLISFGVYIAVALLWFRPEPALDKALQSTKICATKKK